MMRHPRIIIQLDEHGEYEVVVGDKTTGTVCWGEMLDQVVSLTHHEIRQPRFDMRTRDEWANYRGRMFFPPESPCDAWDMPGDDFIPF